MTNPNSNNLEEETAKPKRGFSSFLSSMNSYTLKSTSAFGDEIIFVLFIFTFTVARFFGILIHEFGHGLMAIALGGDFFAFYASPGTGISYLYTENISDGNQIFVNLGGVLAQVIVGIIIFFVYKARRGFAARLFSLQLLLVLLVYSFLYLGLSVFFGGDGTSIVGEIQRTTGFDASIVLVTVSFFFMVLAAHLISIRVMEFLKDHFALVTRKEAFYKFFLFFSLPLLVGFIGAILARNIIPIASIQFFTAFLLVANLLFIVEASFLTRKGKPIENVNGTTGAIAGRESNTVVLSFIVVILLWAAIFGPTPSTAHGIILKEPPLEAEKIFEDRVALNIDVRINPDTVDVYIVTRGLKDDFSPLEEVMWHTYDNRAHWPSHENRSLTIASSAFEVTGWRVESRGIGSVVYGFDQYYEQPRVVGLSMEFENIVKNSSGTHTLTIYDPWRNEPTGPTDNYLHKLNISWSSEFKFLNYSSDPLMAPMGDFETFTEWKNQDIRAAPAQYTLEFSRS